MSDHAHRGIQLPPKHSVASVIGLLKAKSAIAIACQFQGRRRNFNGESFWARGYASPPLVATRSKCVLTSKIKGAAMAADTFNRVPCAC